MVATTATETSAVRARSLRTYTALSRRDKKRRLRFMRLLPGIVFHPFSSSSSSVPPQHHGRIKLHGFAHRTNASHKRDKECGAYDHGEHHRLDVNGRSKYRLAHAMGQHRPGEKSNQGAGQREQTGFRQEEGSHGG